MWRLGSYLGLQDVEEDPEAVKTKAATVIQAHWRGFQARIGTEAGRKVNRLVRNKYRDAKQAMRKDVCRLRSWAKDAPIGAFITFNCGQRRRMHLHHACARLTVEMTRAYGIFGARRACERTLG